MKKSTARRLAVLAAACLTLAACSKQSAVAPTGPTPSPSVAAQCYKPNAAANLFAMDLYQQFKSGDGNVFFSPFSIDSALVMTYEGAGGKTAQEMQSVLKCSTDPAVRRADYQAILAEVNKAGKSYQLSTANNLWLEQTMPFEQAFLDVTSQYYAAQNVNLDFRNDPEGSRQTINDAVAGETQQKIQNLLGAGSITALTRLVLTNAIYFKADWGSPFDPNDTRPQMFYLTSDSSIPVTTMHQTLGGKVEDYGGVAQAFEMPYQSGDVSMFIFLPPPGGMAALEAQLSSSNLDNWMAARSSGGFQQVALSLPKFQFNTSYNLNQSLSAMGMPTAFSPSADFTGMYRNGGLSISSVIHKAFVAVDEKGTEAAAATAVVIGVTNVSITPINLPVPFVVDHPFVFLLYENKVKTILFMGRVNDPTAS